MCGQRLSSSSSSSNSPTDSLRCKRKSAKINPLVELPTRSCSLQAGCSSGQDLPPAGCQSEYPTQVRRCVGPPPGPFHGLLLGAGNDEKREREKERGETQRARADRGTLHESWREWLLIRPSIAAPPCLLIVTPTRRERMTQRRESCLGWRRDDQV
jgi:hypothetical protein